MDNKTYLKDLPKEDVVKMLSYPSALYNYMYDIVAERNGMWAGDAYSEILGKDDNRWVKYDSCSYDWWICVRPGHYANALDIDTENYFNEEDAKELKELKEELKKKCGEIDNLGDDDNYYDKLGELEDEADEIANKMLKIVEAEVKNMEKVDDDQIVEEFYECEYGDTFYILGDDKTKVYRDYTQTYKV